MADSSRRSGAPVVLIGTLDTKGREYAFVRERLVAAGLEPIVIDVGVLGEPPFTPDIGAAEVARAAGHDLSELRFDREGSDTRAVALAAMEKGAVEVIRQLHAERRCTGIIGLGGSGGSTVISAAMRALPVGVPKLLVSTMASGNVRLFVGTSDICLMYSVTDIAGLHRISRRILSNAANALAGMVLGEGDSPEEHEAPLVAITMFGVTTPAVLRVQQRLEAEGFETIVFHAVGAGGAAMEQMIEDGLIDGVVDLTTSELTDEMLGGIFSAGPTRLEAAGRHGIPQVVVPGAVEVLNFGPRDSVPERFDVPERRIVVHNPSVCAVRTNAKESAALGRLLGEKVSRSTGPTAVLLPLGGLSKYEADGGPFVDRQANAALFDAIRDTLRADIPLHEVEANINDRTFADAVADAFLELWQRVP
jgi:uncharacterized protein (UPF0261 family)